MSEDDPLAIPSFLRRERRGTTKRQRVFSEPVRQMREAAKIARECRSLMNKARRKAAAEQRKRRRAKS